MLFQLSSSPIDRHTKSILLVIHVKIYGYSTVLPLKMASIIRLCSRDNSSCYSYSRGNQHHKPCHKCDNMMRALCQYEVSTMHPPHTKPPHYMTCTVISIARNVHNTQQQHCLDLSCFSQQGQQGNQEKIRNKQDWMIGYTREYTVNLIILKMIKHDSIAVLLCYGLDKE